MKLLFKPNHPIENSLIKDTTRPTYEIIIFKFKRNNSMMNANKNN